MKKTIALILCGIILATLVACGGTSESGNSNQAITPESDFGVQNEQSEQEIKTENNTLLYQGHASIRIVTPEGKVIYIDPYAGDGYDLPADLILITQTDDDHNTPFFVKTKNPDCVTIKNGDALVKGEYKTFDLGYVTVEAVQAGSETRDIRYCVGYILTLSNGKSIYVSGDTSTTEQMSTLAERNLDYAFFSCDGIHSMDVEEAAACAALVQAKNNIPYHLTSEKTYKLFDRERAESFDAPNRMILEPGEEIELV